MLTTIKDDTTVTIGNTITFGNDEDKNHKNETDNDKMSVNHLKAMLDKIVFDGKGDYQIDLCIFKDIIGHVNTWYPKINVDVDDESETVTLSGKAI